MTRSSMFLPWYLAALIIALDQITKRIVISSLALHQSVPFIGDIVRWTYIHNEGMAFGVKIAGGRILGVISIVATIFFSYILLKSRNESFGFRMIIGGIIGGAIGNSIDRLAYGYVIDFIDVDLPDWLMERWPIFNIADSAVSVGIVLLIIMIIFRKNQPFMNETIPGFEDATPSVQKVETSVPGSNSLEFASEEIKKSKPDEIPITGSEDK